MIWNSAAEFFAMGGYGLYVWGAYTVALACMAIEPGLFTSPMTNTVGATASGKGEALFSIIARSEFDLVGLVLVCRFPSSHKGFLIFASIALALTAARRLNNAIVAWTDLQDLATYAWLASVMWVPAVAAWTLAWNRWCLRPWRSIDVSAVMLAVAGIIGAVVHSASLTSGSRLGSIALFVVIGARIVRSGPIRILALVTFVSIMAGLFGSELLDPIGVPGIWFPFGIGVSRTQYVYAIAIPLLAFLIVRSELSKETASLSGNHGSWSRPSLAIKS